MILLAPPPARLAIRHGSGLCTVDAEIVDAARRMDEAEHRERMWQRVEERHRERRGGAQAGRG
jgi:hypothetical protein